MLFAKKVTAPLLLLLIVPIIACDEGVTTPVTPPEVEVKVLYPHKEKSTAPLRDTVTVVGKNDARVNWDVEGADECLATGDWSGQKDPSGGSEVVGPFFVPSTSEIILECSNSGGTTTDKAVIHAREFIPAPLGAR